MADLLPQYFALLKRWNERMNLTAADEWEAFEAKHVADARALLPFLEGAHTLVDLGSGAGLPGLLLKIMRPDLEVTLVDATRKKISFCEEAIRRLGLVGACAVQGRAEDERVAQEVGTFDAVVSRATWELCAFIPIALPYLEERGRIIAMKGARWKEELAAAKQVMEQEDLRLIEAHEYRLSGGERRALLLVVHEDS